MKPQAPCPTCGKPVTWEPASSHRPFCSERCRLIDLGDWFNEANRISQSEDDQLLHSTGIKDINSDRLS